MRTPRILISVFGIAFFVEGLVGVIAPHQFRALVIWLQTPPVWPTSVVLRALIGILLLLAPGTVRFPAAIRVVGVITLAGAVVGGFAAHVQQLDESPWWRLPAALLMVAGGVLVLASRNKP
jgi:uncharacterized membrane protein HdeD (DUF308 family)